MAAVLNFFLQTLIVQGQQGLHDPYKKSSPRQAQPEPPSLVLAALAAPTRPKPDSCWPEDQA